MNMARATALLSVLSTVAWIASAHAADATATVPQPSHLIGTMVVGASYPDGWKLERSHDLLGKRDHGYAELSQGRFRAIVLERRLASLSNQNVSEIRDGVLLKGRPNKDGWYELTGNCKGPNGLVNIAAAKRNAVILAEVAFKKCSRYSTNVLSAWLLDLGGEKITPYPANGLQCANSSIDAGEHAECRAVPREW